MIKMSQGPVYPDANFNTIIEYLIQCTFEKTFYNVCTKKKNVIRSFYL